MRYRFYSSLLTLLLLLAALPASASSIRNAKGATQCRSNSCVEGTSISLDLSGAKDVFAGMASRSAFDAGSQSGEGSSSSLGIRTPSTPDLPDSQVSSFAMSGTSITEINTGGVAAASTASATFPAPELSSPFPVSFDYSPTLASLASSTDWNTGVSGTNTFPTTQITVPAQFTTGLGFNWSMFSQPVSFSSFATIFNIAIPVPVQGANNNTTFQSTNPGVFNTLAPVTATQLNSIDPASPPAPNIQVQTAANIAYGSTSPYISAANISVPEPGLFLLAGTGLLCIGLASRKRRR